MSIEDVRLALETRAFASTGANIPRTSIAIGLESDPASKVAGNRWYRATFIPGEPRAAALGDDAPNRVHCIFQIDIFDPKLKGETLTATEAERVRGFYKRGTALVRNGQTTICEKAYREPGVNDGDWYKIPVVVVAWADVPN